MCSSDLDDKAKVVAFTIVPHQDEENTEDSADGENQEGAQQSEQASAEQSAETQTNSEE